MFLENQKEYWALKQREADERYMELAQGQVPVNEPKQKKRKKSKKGMLQEHTSDDTFSMYAAELQVQFFVKVNFCYETTAVEVQISNTAVLPCMLQALLRFLTSECHFKQTSICQPKDLI